MEFKPRPFTRREFMSKLPEPYVNPDTDVEVVGNPNDVSSATLKPGQPEFNRATQVSLKNDTKNKPFSIGLQDIDNAMVYYLEKAIKPTVTLNNRQIEVPVIYGSPERWKSMQADGFYRDRNGKTMVPLVMIKRENFSKNNTLGNKLDGNKVNNVEYFETQYSKNNIYDNFNVLRDQKVEKSYILGVIPDYIDLNYTLSVFTDYTTQANEIIEAIEFAARSYWGDPERFMFRANRSTMNVLVNGYIIPTGIKAAMAGPDPKSYSITKTIFKETVV